MAIFEYIMIYTIAWWLALFMLLPIKAKEKASESVAYHAAPQKTYLKQKLLGATALAIPLTFMVSWIIQSGILMR